MKSVLRRVWTAATAEALNHSTGELETAFFESVYRITYASGLLIMDNPSPIYHAYSGAAKLMTILFLSSELWYLFSVPASLDEVITNITVTIIHVIVLIRYKSMMDNISVYKKLATSMESPYFDVSTTGRKEKLQFWIKLQRKYFRIMLTLACSTLAFWYVDPLTDGIEYNFPAAVRFPFEYRTPARYVISYIVVLIMFHYISFFVVSNDLFLQAQLIHLISQYDVLSDCFENICVDSSDGLTGLSDTELFNNKQFQRQITSRLRNLVEQHKLVLGHTQELRKILSIPMLCQLLGSGILICLAGYQVTAFVTTSIVKFILSALYLAYNLYLFYVLCSWCDEIKHQSRRIGDVIYASGWEQGISIVPGARARFMIVVARASTPLVLTAGGLYDLSLTSYTTLVKTSYSALTLLLRARERRNIS